MKPETPPPTPPLPHAPQGYEWVEFLGRGGMGEVWLAVEPALDRLVALKFLAADRARDPALAERFAREAALAARLSHPHIVTIHRVGEAGGIPFVAMRYFAGGDLAARMRRGALPARAAVKTVVALARALDHAHAAGVLHRDVKPANVLLDESGAPHLADFGLAAEIDAAGITRTGAAAGTPHYLAPEQWRASLETSGAGGQFRAASPATDRYALAVLLYELLLGKPPFAGASAAELPALALREPPPALHVLDRAIAPDLSAICLEGLEKDPARRYASGEAFAADLESYLEGRTVSARLPGLFVRAKRWARAQPVLSTALGATAVALVGTTIAAVAVSERIARERDQARAATTRAVAAESEARARLRGSLLERARATRQTGRIGQRRDALAALREAAAIAPGNDLRNEAAAALALSDWRPLELRETGAGNARAVNPSPDGRRAWIEFPERRFAVFDAEKPRPALAEWTAPEVSAGQSVWSRDGRWIAVQLRNDEVHLIDAATGASRRHWAGFPYAFKGQVGWYGQAMDFSPDGARLALAGNSGEIVVVRTEDGAEETRWNAGGWMINLRFSPDGSQLAAGGAKDPAQNRLAVFEVATGRERAAQPTAGRVDLLEWSADGRWLAVRVVGQGTDVRRAADLAVAATLPDRQALTAHFTRDGAQLFLTEQTGFTRLWEIATARLLLVKSDAGRPGCWYRHLDDGGVEQWRANTGGQVLRSVWEPSPALREVSLRVGNATVGQSMECFDFAPDGSCIAAALEGVVVLAGWPGGEVWQRVAIGDGAGLITVLFERGGGALWVGCNHTGLWRVPLAVGEGGRRVAGAPELVEEVRGFVLAARSHAGNRVALTGTGATADNVRVFDVVSRRRLAAWTHARAAGAAFSPDGGRLAVNAIPGGDPARVYDAAGGAPVFALGDGAGTFVRWSADGRWILAGRDAKRSVLVRAESGEVAQEFAADVGGETLRADFSGDGNWLATKRSDNRFELRSVATETTAGAPGLILPAADFGSWTNAVRFSPDGRSVTFSHIQPRLLVWDLAALRREVAAVGLPWSEPTP